MSDDESTVEQVRNPAHLPEEEPKPKPRPRRKPCRAKGCDEPAGAKGWCREHHRRWLNAQGRR